MDDPTRPETGAERAARIRENIRLYKQEISAGKLRQADLDAYLREEQTTPDVGAEPLSLGDKVRGGVQKALSGASFGTSDELGGTLRAFIPQAGQEGMGFSDRARENARAARQIGQEFANMYPKTATGLEIGGALLMPVGAAAGAATRAGRIFNATKAGAVQGAVGGFLNSEIDPDRGVGGNAWDATKNTAQGAAFGAGAGAVGGGAIEAGKIVGNLAMRGVRGGANMVARSADAVADRLDARRLGSGAPDAPVPHEFQLGTGANPPAAAESPVASALRRAASKQRSAEAQRAVSSGKRIVANRFAAEPGGFGEARSRLGTLEGTGRAEDALLLNTGGNQVTRLARGTRSAPKSRGSGVLEEALADQGSRVAPRVETDISDVSGLPREEGRMALAEMQKRLSQRVEEVYDTFRKMGDLAPPALGEGEDAAEGKLTAWLGDPETAQIFQRYVNGVKRLSSKLRKLPDTDARVVDDAFHLLQREIRQKDATPNRAIDHRLLSDTRDNVLSVIGQDFPEYVETTRQYALDPDAGKAVQDAFSKGMGLSTRPAGDVQATMASFTPAERAAGFRGAVTGLQDRARSAAANPDLGELATFKNVWQGLAGSADDRMRLRSLMGNEAYNDLVKRAKAEMRMVAQNATVRGNSATADKLSDLSELSDDAIGDVLERLVKANGLGPEGFRRLLSEYGGNALSRWRMGVTGNTAGDVADILTTKGAQKIRPLLDELEEISRKAQQSGRNTGRPVTATARVAGME